MGESEVESTSRSGCTGKPDLPTMSFDNGLGYIQAQAYAGILVTGCIVNSVETLEDMIQVFCTDAYTLVHDTYQVVSVFLLQTYHDLAALWGVFDGII